MKRRIEIPKDPPLKGKFTHPMKSLWSRAYGATAVALYTEYPVHTVKRARERGVRYAVRGPLSSSYAPFTYAYIEYESTSR